MSGRTLFALAAIAALVLVGTLIVVERKAPEVKLERGLLLPELSTRLNTITELQVRTYDDEILVARNHKGDWEIPNRGGYPAAFDKVRSLLLALSEARILERKTHNPALYPKLGIQGIDSETSPSVQIIARNKTDETVAELIIGNLKPTSASGVSRGVKNYYVRLPDDSQGLLVRGDLDVSRRLRDWLDDLILDIPETRIRDVLVTHPERTVHIHRPDSDEPDFVLEDIPEGKELKSRTQLNRMGSILSDVRIDDVQRADEHSFGEEMVQSRVETFDGLIVNIRSEYIDGDSLVAFAFETLEDAEVAQQREAAELNGALNPWVFAVPFFKYDTFARKLGPLVQDIDIEVDTDPATETTPTADPATETAPTADPAP